MTSENPSVQTFDIGRVMSRTFSSIGANIVPFTLLALLFAALPQVAIGFVSLPDSPLGVADQPVLAMVIGIGAVLVSIVGAFLLQAGVIHGTVAQLNKRKASFGECLSTAIEHFWPVLGISLLVALGTGLGFILLIVPGIILAILWVVSVPVRVVEKRGVFDSMQRSRDLTRDSRWAIFGLLVIYVVLSWIIGGAALGVGLITGGGIAGAATSPAVQLVLNPLINTVSSIIAAAGAAAIYYELRAIKEGILPEHLVSVFD